MMKYSIYLLLFGFSTCFGQGYSISGTVTDNENMALSNAHIRIKNSIIGTISNSIGGYTLYIPQQNINDTLSISYIGYKTVQIVLNTELSKREMNFELQLDDTLLDEIVITSLSADEIIQRAIKSIGNNYPTNSVKYNGYFKFTQSINEEYTRFFDAQIEIFDPGYSQNATLYKERVFLDHYRLSDNLSKKGFNNRFDYSPLSHIHTVLVDNYVKYLRGLLDKKSKYELDSITQLDGQPIYIIKVTKKPYYLNKEALPTNDFKLFINSEDYAIIKIIEEEHSPEITSDNISSLRMKIKTNDSIDTYIIDRQVIMEFKKFKSKYILSYVHDNHTVIDYNTHSNNVFALNKYDRVLICNSFSEIESINYTTKNGLYEIDYTKEKHDKFYWNRSESFRFSNEERIFDEIGRNKQIESQFMQNRWE